MLDNYFYIKIIYIKIILKEYFLLHINDRDNQI